MGKEKKEIGKLLELLNEFGEYDLVEHNGEICKWDTDDEGEINIYTDYTNNIISKKFGFIKWLVENDKIRKDIYRPIPLGIKATYEDGVVYYDKLEDRIIMLLSISDTPIEDLISYLK